MLIQNNSWIFQDAVTTASNGNVFYSGHNDQLTVFITGTSTSFTVVFEGCDNNDNWYALPAIKLSDLTTVWSTSNKGAYVINLALCVGVRCRVSAVASGTVSVIGRIVEVGTSLINNKDVQLSGSNMDLRGLATNKPAANAVTIGATYWSIDIDPHGDAIEVSNGTSWVVV